MNKNRNDMNRRLVLSARQLYFFQQKRMEKGIDNDSHLMDGTGQNTCDAEDNENYLLGYN